jgi:hypothetical protein
MLELSLDKVPTGANARVDQSFIMRRNTNGDYRAMLRVLTGGQVRVDFVRNLGSTSTSVGPQVTLPFTYGAGDIINVRAQATGSSPTTLRVKAWRQGTSEPASWSLAVTDAAAGLQQAGSIGLSPYLSGSATNAPVQARYDNLRAAIASTLP